MAAAAAELACRQRQYRIAAGEQPDLGPGDAVPVAQEVEELGGEHGKAIFAAFALLDPQQKALGLDVRHLERDDFGDA
jgi:hypothetical protein